MSYRILKSDPSPLMERYGISCLSAASIAASSLSKEQIIDLLDPSDQLTVSTCEALDKVCRRIMEAGKNREKVFIAGDYDADGICSTAIMKDILDRLGIENGYYIPDRFKEGYGLSSAIVSLAEKKGYRLIITVDNGVKCFESIQLAKSLGMDVIVTDHHQIEEPVPGDLLLHPDVMEDRYAYLSGAGVVLEISRALLGSVPSHTALACIALIGDVMPLWKETRKIVRRGMIELEHGALPAVSALLKDPGSVDVTAVSFQIVPKLNSVGRMDDQSNVNTLVPFLLCSDPVRIAKYAKQLESVNNARRRRSDAMVKKALTLEADDPFPIVFDESFFEGVNGLAAGKLARQWHKPVLVFARHDQLLKGSGRSIAGFDMYSFFAGFDELEQFGGHTGAVGLSVREDRFSAFCDHVQARMKETALPSEVKDPAFLIDDSHLNIEEIMEFESLRPYPRELVTHAAIRKPLLQKVNAYDRVIRYHFTNETGGYDGIQFTSSRTEPEREIRWLIGTPGINRFRSHIGAEIRIEAFDGDLD